MNAQSSPDASNRPSMSTWSPQLKVIVKDLWKLIRGKLYAKFALGLVALGVSCICGPGIYWILGSIVIEAWYRRLWPDRPPPPLTPSYWEPLILGIILVGSGIGIFVYCFLREQRVLEEGEAERISRLLAKWERLHALKAVDEDYNPDDVRAAIIAVNEAANLCIGSENIANRMFESHGSEFLLLFEQLSTNRYRIEERNATSDELLSDNAKVLQRRFLEQTALQ